MLLKPQNWSIKNIARDGKWSDSIWTNNRTCCHKRMSAPSITKSPGTNPGLFSFGRIIESRSFHDFSIRQSCFCLPEASTAGPVDVTFPFKFHVTAREVGDGRLPGSVQNFSKALSWALTSTVQFPSQVGCVLIDINVLWFSSVFREEKNK